MRAYVAASLTALLAGVCNCKRSSADPLQHACTVIELIALQGARLIDAHTYIPQSQLRTRTSAATSRVPRPSGSVRLTMCNSNITYSPDDGVISLEWIHESIRAHAGIHA
jgi:hypothetical protein